MKSSRASGQTCLRKRRSAVQQLNTPELSHGCGSTRLFCHTCEQTKGQCSTVDNVTCQHMPREDTAEPGSHLLYDTHVMEICNALCTDLLPWRVTTKFVSCQRSSNIGMDNACPPCVMARSKSIPTRHTSRRTNTPR